MEVKFEGTCIFEGDPIDEVLGLRSNGTGECAAPENAMRATSGFKKADKEFERQLFINKFIDVVGMILIFAILGFGAVFCILLICS